MPDFGNRSTPRPEPPSLTSARDLYAAMVLFAQENGLRREEKGSGWWYGSAVESDVELGEAVQILLMERHGIDVRESVPGEPEEFWG